MRHDPSTRTRRRAGTLRVGIVVALAALVGTTSVQARVTSPYVRTSIEALAPGIAWEKGTARTSKGIQAIQVGRIDMQHSQVTLEALLSNDKVVKLERPSVNADRHSSLGARAIIATNGDVSTVGDRGAGAHPPSMHVHDGEVWVGTFCGRPTLGIDPDGRARMGSVRLKTELDLSSIISNPWKAYTSIRGVNRKLSSNQLIIYTNRWGPSTLTSLNATEVIVDPDDIVRPNGRFHVTVMEVRRNTTDTTIPAGRMVLSGTNAKATFLNQLSPGDRVAIDTRIFTGEDQSCAPSELAPGWGEVEEMMGGNYFTVRNGRNVAPSYSAYPNGGVAAPRTNLGITADGDVLMVVVDGRQSGYSIGMTLQEMGDLMLQLGAVAAFNLDGGGSSVMARRRIGADHITVSNRPSDGRERSLTQSFAAFSHTEP